MGVRGAGAHRMGRGQIAVFAGLAAVVAVAGVGPAAARAGVVHYEETFATATTNAPVATAGWRFYAGSSAADVSDVATQSSVNHRIQTPGGNTDGGADDGYVRFSNQQNRRGLVFRSEFAPIAQADVESLAFDGLTSVALRLVVRLDTGVAGDASDDQWFASAASFPSSPTTAWTEHALAWPAPGEAAWQALNFVAGSSLPAPSATDVALPAGDVAALGVYVPASTSGVSMDDFRIVAVPEPASAAALAGAAFACLSARRRPRRKV